MENLDNLEGSLHLLNGRYKFFIFILNYFAVDFSGEMWSGQVPDWLLFVFQSFSRLVWMLHLYGCVLFTLSGICLWHHSLLTSHDSVKRVRRISLQVTAGTGVFLPLPSEPELRWSSERWRLSEQRQGCQSLQSHSLRERQAQQQLKYTAHINQEGQHTVLTWTNYGTSTALKTTLVLLLQ